MTRLTRKALRIYEEKGILVPGAKEPLTGYRYYTVDQIELGLKVKDLVTAGFSLEEVARVLEAESEGDRGMLRRLIEGRMDALRSEARHLERVRGLLLGTDGSANMSIEQPVVKEVPSQRVLCKREKGVYGVTIGKLIGELFTCIMSNENRREMVTMTGPPIFICHDQEYMETDADIEVAIPIAGRVRLCDDSMEVRTLEGGRFLTMVHRGAYDRVGESHARLQRYALEHGIEWRLPDREVYISDPDEVAEEDLVTELQYPLP